MMKKALVIALSAATVLCTVPVCAQEAAAPVKTGIGVVTDYTHGTKDASADANGLCEADLTMVAVTVDEAGVIQACAVDVIQGKIEIDAAGAIVTDAASTFLTKAEIKDDYGMRKASSIGAEWYEQAAGFEEFVVGKTIDEILAIELDDNGKTDAIASCTITCTDMIAALEKAVANAQDLGASATDALCISSTNNIAKSKDATADADGLAQTYATMAAITANADGVITSCAIDAIQANINFDATGVITSAIEEGGKTKNELMDDYGMRKASGIGAEWFEQAASFGAYVVGKTPAEVVGIEVDENDKAVDADLLTSVTVSIDGFQELFAKIMQ